MIKSQGSEGLKMECQNWLRVQDRFDDYDEPGPETPAVEQPGCDCKDDDMKKYIVHINDAGHEYTFDLHKIVGIDWHYTFDPEPPGAGDYIAIFLEGAGRPFVLAQACGPCLRGILKNAHVRPIKVLTVP